MVSKIERLLLVSVNPHLPGGIRFLRQLYQNGLFFDLKIKFREFAEETANVL